MMWGCISSHGPGYVCEIDGNMTQSHYLDILSKEFQQTLSELNIEGQISVIHDGAPCHRSISVLNYFKKKKIELIKFPPYSPDLNIIENAWHITKTRIYKKKIQFKSKENLRKAFCDEFYCISTEYCQKLASSMPKRLLQVIKNKGYQTSY